MDESKLIKVGDKVTDFTLKDQDENKITLSDFKGKRVLLSFHPMAWTGVCTDQMKALEANYSKFEELNTVPLGLSCDPVPTKKAWADDMGLEKLRILSDFWPHGKVAESLGLFRETSGISERANVVLDESGKAIFVKVYPIGDLPDIDEVISFLAD
jgi:peroxiredoxin